MSTLPFGGCHGLLLGCGINNINPLHLWSYYDSTLLASTYPCVNRAYQSSLVCWHWHGHPVLVAVLHRVLYSINPFQYVDLISGLSSCENQHLVADCQALFYHSDEEMFIGLILWTLVCGLQYSVALIIVGLAFNFGNNCVGSVVWRPSEAGSRHSILR